MEYAARRNQKGAFEGFYKLIMRRNSVYVTFIIAGAFFGERAVDYGVHKLWERNNVGVCLFSCILNHVLCNLMPKCVDDE
ncbi:putative cytochrome b-c1 complex subunit 9 [Arabidopsis thaliana]|uniref:Complex III subunit 9 n=1 Tax=Arabidopsis thaliana TaxID=3702 RepID=A0A5S9XK83_ARATH|nr:unnamed protein product [Arabidopsis thaliana]